MLVNSIFYPFTICECRPLYWTGIAWGNSVLWMLRIICGIKYKVTGLENIPKTPFIIASKHQSAFETALFWKLFYIPTFILKKELTKVPLFGIFLVKMKMICIDREAGAFALKQIMKEAPAHVLEGRKVIIYPEGTRTDPKIKTPEYNAGVFALYKACNVPILPIALNSGVFWPKKGPMKSGTIQVRILPAILPGLEREGFMTTLRTQIEDASFKLAKSTHAPASSL